MNGNAIALHGIVQRFGAQTVLDGIELSVCAGERHALIGPNGAGKSTLFGVIAGATRPTRGRVVLHGVELRGRAGRRERLGIGRSFQQTSAFSRLSVFDNLRCARCMRRTSGGAGGTGCANRRRSIARPRACCTTSASMRGATRRPANSATRNSARSISASRSRAARARCCSTNRRPA
nr:ATP-binding cassette domain-containing protein [Burkholderia ambifaria]